MSPQSQVVEALLFIAAALLIASGTSKVRRPAATATALSVTGFEPAHALVRAFGGLEVGIGATALFAPRPLVVASAGILYLGFAAFLTYVVVGRVPVRSCGCLGSREVRPSLLHAGLDLVAAGACFAAAVSTPPGIVTWASQLPFFGIPGLAGLAAGCYLAYLMVSFLPELFFSYAKAP